MAISLSIGRRFLVIYQIVFTYLCSQIIVYRMADKVARGAVSICDKGLLWLIIHYCQAYYIEKKKTVTFCIYWIIFFSSGIRFCMMSTKITEFPNSQHTIDRLHDKRSLVSALILWNAHYKLIIAHIHGLWFYTIVCRLLCASCASVFTCTHLNSFGRLCMRACVWVTALWWWQCGMACVCVFSHHFPFRLQSSPKFMLVIQ